MECLAAGFTCDENFCFSSSMEKFNWTFLLHAVIIYQFMYSEWWSRSSKILRDGGLVWGSDAGKEGFLMLVANCFRQSHCQDFTYKLTVCMNYVYFL